MLEVVTGPFSLIYVPNALFVSGNAVATANNILAHEMLFRLGIVGDLLNGLIGLFVVLALYRLFKEVDQSLAALMVILGGLMVTPLFFINAVNWIAALLLVRGGGFLSVFQKPQQDALAMLFIHLHSQVNVVNEIFWGLWLFPFGVLVMKSRFLPRLLGLWLIVGGFAYLVLSFTGLLAPQYQERVFQYSQPAIVGEIAIALWLLFIGARVRPAAAAS